ncbi:MAG: hypothetical protein AB8A32_02700 [Prochlorococcus sp.]
MFGDVKYLFALHICARPLAGPPEGEAGPAIAPDPQARAAKGLIPLPAGKLIDSKGRPSPSQLILSLALSEIASSTVSDGLRSFGDDCVSLISANHKPPTGLRTEVIHAGAFTFHVYRHPWEETGHVPVLRRTRQSRPGHPDRGRSLPHHPTKNL